MRISAMSDVSTRTYGISQRFVGLTERPPLELHGQKDLLPAKTLV